MRGYTMLLLLPLSVRAQVTALALGLELFPASVRVTALRLDSADPRALELQRRLRQRAAP